MGSNTAVHGEHKNNKIMLRAPGIGRSWPAGTRIATDPEGTQDLQGQKRIQRCKDMFFSLQLTIVGQMREQRERRTEQFPRREGDTSSRESRMFPKKKGRTERPLRVGSGNSG